MNERIADLMEQAFDRCKKYDDEGKIGLVRTTEAFNMFAELIVRECAAKAWWAEQYGIGDGVPIYKQIEQHFGVE